MQTIGRISLSSSRVPFSQAQSCTHIYRRISHTDFIARIGSHVDIHKWQCVAADISNGEWAECASACTIARRYNGDTTEYISDEIR